MLACPGNCVVTLHTLHHIYEYSANCLWKLETKKSSFWNAVLISFLKFEALADFAVTWLRIHFLGDCWRYMKLWISVAMHRTWWYLFMLVILLVYLQINKHLHLEKKSCFPAYGHSSQSYPRTNTGERSPHKINPFQKSTGLPHKALLLSQIARDLSHALSHKQDNTWIAFVEPVISTGENKLITCWQIFTFLKQTNRAGLELGRSAWQTKTLTIMLFPHPLEGW